MLSLTFSLAIDMCRMTNTSAVYPLATALQCLTAPTLPYNVFKQNQQTIQTYAALYAFTDEAITPPSEYANLRVNITGFLATLGDNYSEYYNATPDNISAYYYFANISKLFMSLKDGNTFFQKPHFFGDFQIVFPFQFTNRGGFFYASNFENNTPQYQQFLAYESQYGQLSLNATDSIFWINGMDPLEYFTNFSDVYDFAAKSDHGRLNNELSGALYNKRLDIYNMLQASEEKMMIQFLSGKQLTVYFTVMTTTSMANSSQAQQLFNSNINMTSPFQNVTQQPKFIQNVHSRDVVFDSEFNLNSFNIKAQPFNMQMLLNASNFYQLYSFSFTENNTTYNEFALQIQSFMGDTELLNDTLEDVLTLLKKLVSLNISNNQRLFISVAGARTGLPAAAALLAYALFPSEYPIYGRYNIRKTDLIIDMIQSDCNFEWMHRVDWISGQTYTNLTNDTNTSWYNATINGKYSQYYGYDDDQYQGILNITQQIYNLHTLNLNPNQVILLTDANCEYACAQFAKHLVQMHNCYSIGFGGAYNSTNNFDAGSAIGGVVSSSDNYVLSIQNLAFEGWNGLNDTQIENLTNVWFPHNGGLQFVHDLMYSFNSTEAAQLPLEYRSFPVNTIINQYPFLYGWKALPGLIYMLPLAMQELVSFASDNNTWYAGVCGALNQVISRWIMENSTNNCVPYGCAYGYYRIADDNDSFSCDLRTDQYYVPGYQMTGGVIAAICCGGFVLLCGIAALVIWCVNPAFYKCQQKGNVKQQKKAEEKEELLKNV